MKSFQKLLQQVLTTLLAFKYTRTAGFMSYYEVCEKITKGWSKGLDEEQKVPYAFLDNQWVGYDDKESLALKVIL